MELYFNSLIRLRGAVINYVQGELYFHFISSGGRGSSVGIATRYGLDGPGIESLVGVRLSAHVQTDPGAHPASYIMNTGKAAGAWR